MEFSKDVLKKINKRPIRFDINIDLMKKVDDYFWNDHPHLIGTYVPTGGRISYVLIKATEKKITLI